MPDTLAPHGLCSHICFMHICKRLASARGPVRRNEGSYSVPSFCRQGLPLRITISTWIHCGWHWVFGAAIVILCLFRRGAHRTITALCLLALLFVQGEAAVLGIPNEPDFGKGVAALWNAMSGQEDAALWPSVISVASWRFLWVFLVTILIVAIQRTYAKVCTIHVGPLISRPLPYQRIQWTDRTPEWRKQIAELPRAFRPFVWVLFVGFRVLARVWVGSWNAALVVAYRAKLAMALFADRLLRAIARYSLRCWEIIKGSKRAFVESVSIASVRQQRLA